MKVIAIGGMPATGKSTLVGALMKNIKMKHGEGAHWVDEKFYDLVYGMRLGDNIVLGKYDEEEKFPGTDKLSMAVMPKAMEWFKANKRNQQTIIFEGDRLYSAKFLEFLDDIEEIDLEIYMLETDDAKLHQRHIDREDTQSEKFLKGRTTKYGKIMSNFNLAPYIKVRPNNNTDDQTAILAEILLSISK